jgi:hypothetical protein
MAKLNPESAGVPSWLISLAVSPNGGWDKARFESALSVLENFCFLRRENKGGQDMEEERNYDIWIHPLVHQWTKEDLEPDFKRRFALEAIWSFVHSIDDCAQDSDHDVLLSEPLHALGKTDRRLRAFRSPAVGVSAVAIRDMVTVMKDLAGMGDQVSFIHRSGQFQTGGGGIVDEFSDLMLILQDFQTLLDHAYCPELDPHSEYKSIPQFEFHDTYAILMAFQARKLVSPQIRNASAIFKMAKGFCKRNSEYAQALLLSGSVVHDSLHWDRLVRWAPLVDELISKLRSPRENLDSSFLTIAACGQLAISFAYAVGHNHHNNTNPRADPMNFSDQKRHQALTILSSVASVTLRSLEMVKAY